MIGSLLVHDDEATCCSFVHAHMETMTLGEQLELDRRTDLLIGVHGNGLTHSIFMQPNRFTVELYPKGVRRFWDYYMLSVCNAHQYLRVFDGVPVHEDDPAYHRPGAESQPNGEDISPRALGAIVQMIQRAKETLTGPVSSGVV